MDSDRIAPPKIIRSIQYLRALAALAVVLYHMHLWEWKAYGDSGVVPRWNSIGDAGVDLFFVISGFIMLHIQPTRLATGRAWGEFLGRRMARIFPPYWCVCLLLLPLWWQAPKLFNNYYQNQVDIIRSFLLLPQDFTPLLAVGWTLIHEVFFYIVVSFALFLSPVGRIRFGLLWFLLVAVVFWQFGQAHFGQNRVLQLVFSPFSLTFLLGYFLALCHPWIRRLPWLVSLAVLLVGCVWLGFGAASIPRVGVYPDNNHMFRFVAFGLPCALLVCGVLGLDAHWQRGSRILARLGDASYALYLTHLPLVAGFYAALKYARVHGEGMLAGAALGCLLLCICVAMAFYFVIERPGIRIAKRLIDTWIIRAPTRPPEH